jgi:hypothetical protein
MALAADLVRAALLVRDEGSQDCRLSDLSVAYNLFVVGFGMVENRKKSSINASSRVLGDKTFAISYAFLKL